MAFLSFLLGAMALCNHYNINLVIISIVQKAWIFSSQFRQSALPQLTSFSNNQLYNNKTVYTKLVDLIGQCHFIGHVLNGKRGLGVRVRQAKKCRITKTS